MPGKIHEIRDPIHAFIRLDSAERMILDSPPFQRLRNVHQLALTYLVYPGATHRRFEHSLGVMELASRIYDVVTFRENLLHDSVRDLVPSPRSHEDGYWKLVLRMAALCHDLGHLPFSHAAEKELLPEGYNHEKLSLEIILSEYLRPFWKDLKIQAEDVAKLAVGPRYFPGELNLWETILAEIIIGDAFGADRMDYLLRDSYHAGVPYGRFDHYRLIDTLCILPKQADDSDEPTLGIRQGGLQSAEALLWARYFMYTQLYFHPVRRAYDIHLKDFLAEWLSGGKFPTDLEKHLTTTDNEVLAAILEASRDPKAAGHEHSHRILSRKHFRVLYEKNPTDMVRNLKSVDCVFEAATAKFSPDNVRRDTYAQHSGGLDFPVYTRDGRIQQSRAMSDTLTKVPTFAIDYVLINPELRNEAQHWLEDKRESVIPQVEGRHESPTL